MLLLDSNSLIYFFKNAGAVRSHMAQCKDIDIKLCTPVLWELLTGAFKSQDSRSQMARLAAVETRPTILQVRACAGLARGELA